MAGGRPTKMTPETVKKLEDAFLLGCTDEEACFCAGITKPTLYDYCKEHPEFSDRKEILKRRPVYLARKVQLEALQDGDRAIAVKLIERADGTKSVLSGDPDKPINHKWTVEFVNASTDE